MKFWVAVTDPDWFQFLESRRVDEANFWQPTDASMPRAIVEGTYFLFKLRKSNFVAGCGLFVRFLVLPASLAWDAFREKNGTASYVDLVNRLRRLRQDQSATDPRIGCNVLADPIFFSEDQWIPVPPSWPPNTQRGKTFNTSEEDGRLLWKEVALRLQNAQTELQQEVPRYGEPQLVQPRLGQGAFRVLVTDAYHRRCAISGERTLPALEAAHIKPYAESGPHQINNGLLLRSDFHRLFDAGYITVTPKLVVEVSRRIKTEFENGHEYYQHDGQKLAFVPKAENELPSLEFLAWHNERFLG